MISGCPVLQLLILEGGYWMRIKPAIRKCPSCNNYTMKIECENCRIETQLPKPARFSPEDKYGKYRRKLKKMVKENPK